MRKVIFQNLVSLDGFFEGPNRDISWHNADAEFNEYAVNFPDTVDLLLFGRAAYRLMAGYRPAQEAIRNDPLVADKMSSISKIVFSKTPEKADWPGFLYFFGPAARFAHQNDD